jgi:hypothetical protein
MFHYCILIWHFSKLFIALAHLCEYIEDCEFTPLSVRILHLLGIEGPKLSSPSKCIRYIYNRIILENSVIRVAAVSALGRFAAAFWYYFQGNLSRFILNSWYTYCDY